MSPNNVLEAVLGAAVVAAAVGEEQGGAAHAEEAVRDEHRAVLTGVPIKAHHFSANNQSIVIRVSLEHVTGQIQRYDPRAAPHSSEVEAQDVSPQLVVAQTVSATTPRKDKSVAKSYVAAALSQIFLHAPSRPTSALSAAATRSGTAATYSAWLIR
nr:Os03g0181550 [Ipomoea batatas]